MSYRKSSSTGEGLPSKRYGERTPLRSLENEALHMSTPSSRLKSKSQPSADVVKTTEGDVLQYEAEPHLLSPPPTGVIKNNAPMKDMTPAGNTCRLTDVTFKSFICPGGEVEISYSSAEESVVLTNNQSIINTCQTEDTVISDSMFMQSCSDHEEHPYYNPEIKEASLIESHTACLTEVPSTKLPSENLDDKCNSQNSRVFQNDCCGATDVTWKSFVCDGDEVEISDVTRIQDNTIPLPKPELGEFFQDDTLNYTNLSDCDQLYQAKHAHADHPYCSSENDAPVVTTLSQSPKCSEKPVDGLSEVTFKSFNCTGGEIEISDGTRLGDETVSLSANHAVTCIESCSYDVDASILAGDHDFPNGKDHLDHPYCNSENCVTTPNGNFSTSSETPPYSAEAVDEVEQIHLVVTKYKDFTFDSFNQAVDEVEKSTHLFEKTSPLSKDQAKLSFKDNAVPTHVTQENIQDDCEQPSCHVGNDDVVDTPPSSLTNAFKTSNNESVDCQVPDKSNHSICLEDSTEGKVQTCKTESVSCSQIVASAGIPTPVELPQHLENFSEVDFSSAPPESSEGKDSALGSTGNGPVHSNSEEKPCAENFTDVLKVLSECPSVASALQLGILSPVVRRASLSTQKDNRDPALDQFLGDDSALEVEKSLVAPLNLDPAGLWAEYLESPMPRPLFNSTTLGYKPQSGPTPEPDEDVFVKPRVMPQSKVEKPVLDIPVIQEGPLQQQLRQMAEFLMLASGKMGPTAVSDSAPLPANVVVPSQRATPVETHSVCVGTTAVQMVDHSLNTSGQFERKREFSVADSCTITDPLLWNVPPGSLEGLPRQELEQRLRSSMIMVEALVQQLAAARAHGCPSAGAPPSELREKQVQTDHTELSQTTMYRDLYMEALSRIRELEQDGSSLHNLIQNMQNMRVTMTSLSTDTEAALANISKVGDIVREDHQSLISHYGQMKSLFKKTKETQKRMMQKVKDALQQRNDMRTQMEEAFTAKEAAFSTMEQLRTHCAREISALEKCVGSQQELLAALNQAYPEQVALNQAYTERLNSASDLLTLTIEEQASLMNELGTVRGLLQKTAPMLLKLNEKAAAALRERDEHFSAREQAIEEREQIEEELSQTNLDLQTAREQIGDLNLQVTILTSEMDVLRQKLTEREEARGQLERKATELSATVSSTLASYAFLEQALAAETTKLQQSWKDIQQAKDRATELEKSLGHSEQCVSELSQALAQSEEQLCQLQTLSQSQKAQIQQLQDVCTQLNGVREMNEFLQMENELAREQVAESERMLRANLQGLRERNIECEDLKGELGQLQLENRSLQEQLETTRSRASATQLDLGEKLAHAVTEITLVHHTLRGLTNELHSALDDQKPEAPKEVSSVERRHPSSSFIDSIMIALTNEKEEVVHTETPPGPDMPEPQCETLFSETSAFTRIAVITPKQNLNAVEFEPEEDEQTSVAELLADLGSTVTELVNTMNLVRQRKDAQLDELKNTICGLQREQQAANSRHETEVSELKHQLRHLNSLLERGNQALQQKSQDEKTLSKLMEEIKEVHEILNKHKTDNNELKKEVVELRRSLQQSKVESQFLREELRKTGGQSATPAHLMEEKIQLLKEVERLKVSLQEVEQARAKLLERAKRHQMIHQTNQLKSENELQMLNNMINKVRETLLSLPGVVKNCEQLQQLVEYIG